MIFDRASLTRAFSRSFASSSVGVFATSAFELLEKPRSSRVGDEWFLEKGQVFQAHPRVRLFDRQRRQHESASILEDPDVGLRHFTEGQMGKTGDAVADQLGVTISIPLIDYDSEILLRGGLGQPLEQCVG